VNINHFLLRIAVFSTFLSLHLPLALQATVVSLSLQPYPFAKEPTSEQLSGILRQPGKLGARVLLSAQAIERTQGIVGTYNGFVSFSDQNGQITFPRMQTKDTVSILITERITPVIMFGNTIHHWQRDPAAPADLYTLSRITNTQTKKLEWLIEKMQLPANDRIELDTLVLLGKPSAFYLPVGTIPTEANPNLLLPPVYVKKNINSTIPALWLIKVRQFFKPVAKEFKKVTDTYYSEQPLQ
jgi:hypothetical protein